MFVVACGCERHRVEVGPSGVRFLDHPEVYEHLLLDKVAELLGGAKAGRPIGCCEIAAMVRSRYYLAAGNPQRSVRTIMATLRGKQSFRRMRRRNAIYTNP